MKARIRIPMGLARYTSIFIALSMLSHCSNQMGDGSGREGRTTLNSDSDLELDSDEDDFINTDGGFSNGGFNGGTSNGGSSDGSSNGGGGSALSVPVEISPNGSQQRTITASALSLSGNCDGSDDVHITYGSNLSGNNSVPCEDGSYSFSLSISGESGSRNISFHQAGVTRPANFHYEESVVGQSDRQLSASVYHTCVVRNGNIYCWGRNDYAQLGNSCAMTNSFSKNRCYNGAGQEESQRNIMVSDWRPQMVVNGANSSASWSQVAVGERSSCALDGDGKAYCWGNNTYGQLGVSGMTVSYRPVAVDTSLRFSQIASGRWHTCGVELDNGLVYCWGWDGEGQLGDGVANQAGVYAPQVTQNFGSAGSSVVDLSAGDSSTCAALSNGDTYCWGHGLGNKMGDGSTNHRRNPAPTLASLDNMNGDSFSSLDVGAYHTCGVSEDNKIYCWGRNQSGQHGIDSANDVATPTDAVTGSFNFEKVATSEWRADNRHNGGSGNQHSHTCAITDNRQVLCWGHNSAGQLGTLTSGSTPLDSHTPATVNFGSLSGLNFVDVSAGASHTCALSDQGRVFCWGYSRSNDSRLGTQRTDQANTPVEVFFN